MVTIILLKWLSHFPISEWMSHFERVSPGGRGFSVRVWSGAAVANVCGKRSRASHGVWSLLVLSAIADSSEGFDGTHQKPSLCFLLPYVPC